MLCQLWLCGTCGSASTVHPVPPALGFVSGSGSAGATCRTVNQLQHHAEPAAAAAVAALRWYTRALLSWLPVLMCRYQRIAEHKKAGKEREASVQPGSSEQSPAGGAAQQAGQGGQLPPLAASYSQLTRFEAVPTTQNSSLQVIVTPWGQQGRILRPVTREPGASISSYARPKLPAAAISIQPTG